MGERYNKQHVQMSVKVAVAYGMVFGFWLGNRMAVAPWWEALIVFIGLNICAAYSFSWVDRKYLIEP